MGFYVEGERRDWFGGVYEVDKVYTLSIVEARELQIPYKEIAQFKKIRGKDGPDMIEVPNIKG